MKYKVFIPTLALAIAISTPGVAQADYNYNQVSSEGRWEWDIDSSSEDGVDDARFYLGDNEGEDDLVSDTFDDFGLYSITIEEDDTYFDTSSEDGDIVEGELIFTEYDNNEEVFGTVRWTFINNVWTQVLTSLTPGALLIQGDLGSDSGTTWRTQGSYFISYEQEDGFVGNDPIIVWETDGNIASSSNEGTYENGNDDVEVSETGTQLTLTLYLYPHVRQNEVDIDTYFAQFEEWLNQDKFRTDVFRHTPAPVISLRRSTTNLFYSDSQFGSDRLSDPDGELRRLVDTIMARYGNLIP